MVRGPCQDIPSTSPEDRGRRLFSTDDTMPSLRPLACCEVETQKRLDPYRSVSSDRYKSSDFTLMYMLKTIFIRVACVRPHPLLYAYKGNVGGRLSFIHRRLCPDPTRTEFHQCQQFYPRLPLVSEREAVFSPATARIMTFITPGQQWRS